MKYYIAGPMSGIPQFNYPAFDAAAKSIRSKKHEAVSPAEMDDEATRAAALASKTGNFNDFDSDETWGDFLSRDVKIVADQVDGVVLLSNWHTSRGARLEAFVALCCQKPIYNIDLQELNPKIIAKTIMENTVDQGDTSRYEAA